MRKREFEKLLKQAIIEEAEEQGAIFEASPETEPIPETAQARFDAALNGKRRPNRSVFTRLRYFAYRNGRRLAFGAIAAGIVAALVLVVGLLTRTVLNGEKGGSAPENSDHASTSAPVRTSEPGPLETNEPEGTEDPFAAITSAPGSTLPASTPEPTETTEPVPASDALFGVWEILRGEDEYFTAYLELFDDGTVRFIDDIDYRNAADVKLVCSATQPNGYEVAFRDTDRITKAVYDPASDTLRLTFPDGTERTAVRRADCVLARTDPNDDSIRNPVALPAESLVWVAPGALYGLKEAQLFAYDLDGDGTEEKISYSINESETNGSTHRSIRIRFGEPEELGKTAVVIDEKSIDFIRWSKLSVPSAVLLRPDPASNDYALVLNIQTEIDEIEGTLILFLHDGNVVDRRIEYDPAGLSNGKLYFSTRCDIFGTEFGRRAYVGAKLEPESEWYEVRDKEVAAELNLTRAEQIEFHYLLHVIRDLPCTVDGKKTVIKADTYVYFTRFRDTEDLAEVETEDGRIAQIEIELVYSTYADGSRYVSDYLIDGVSSKDYFDNLSHAG